MGKRGGALIGLACVAIIATVAWWLLVGRSASGDESGPANARSATDASLPGGTSLPTSSPADAPLPLLAESTPTIDSTAADPARAGSLATLSISLVHDADESPVPDAEVWVFAKITDTESPKHSRQNARTAADGQLRFEFDHAVRVWLVRAMPGDGHALVELRPEPDLDIALGDTQPLELRAPRGAVVRGQVVDEGQRPVPLASVLAWCDMRYNVESGDGPLPDPDLRAECDTAGRFELGGVGPQLVLMPEVSGMAVVSGVSGPIAEGAVVNDVTLIVGPAVELPGRVVDPTGQPVSHTWVQARHTAYMSMQAGLDPAVALKVGQVTNDEGRFALAPLAPKPWRVSVSAEGFPPWSQRVTPDGSELLIQLSSGLALSGVVYGADGAPLDGADVLLAGASENERGEPGGTASTQTIEGRFAFSALVPTREAAVGVSAAGHAIVVVEPVIVSDEPAAPLEIRLEPQRVIGGRIIDEHDQPLEGAYVSARGDRHVATEALHDVPWEDWFWPRVSEAQSDSDGRFRLERLYDGNFELSVDDPRTKGLRHIQSVHSGVDDLLIRLDPALLRRAVLSGTVRDGVTRAPIDDFVIWLHPLDPERQKRGMRLSNGGEFKQAGGVFNLQGIEPGRWRAVVNAHGYAPVRSDELELRDGEQHVDLELLPERSLSMRIVDQDHEPVHGAFLHFEDTRGHRIELRAQPLGNRTIGMTDKAGEVTAHGLPADRISIVLNLSLVPNADVGRREVRLPVDLRVQPEGVQEFTIERRKVRCLVLSLSETDAAVAVTVYDTVDESAQAALLPLLEQDVLRPSERSITVTVTDADDVLIDSARCAPNASAPGKWSVTSSVCSTDEPASWLATALPAGPSRAVITAEGCEPVTLDLPGGEQHLRRYVILRPVAQR